MRRALAASLRECIIVHIFRIHNSTALKILEKPVDGRFGEMAKKAGNFSTFFVRIDSFLFEKTCVYSNMIFVEKNGGGRK